MTRTCARSRRWLAEVASRYGSPVGHGAVRLECSQADLAHDAGCSPGTIQARIRVLERHGLILSRRPLTVRLDPPAAGTVSAGTASTSSPVGAGGELRHLLTANAALGEALKGCPSVELFEAQRLVLAALGRSLAVEPEPQAPAGDHPGVTYDAEETRGSARYERPGTAQARGSAGYDPAKPADPLGMGPEDPRKAADPRVSSLKSVSQETLSVVEKQPDSLTSRERGSASPRDSDSRTRGHPSPNGGTPSRPPTGEAVTTTAQINELVRPLAAVAERCGLLGITDRTGLHQALEMYSTAAISHAVSQVSRMTKAGQIRSPFGLLIAAGRRGDIDLFPTSAPPTTPPSLAIAIPRAEHDPLAEAAEAALAIAGADELARLDEWIRSAPHHARIRDLIFDPARAAMLHTARLEAWRALQKEAS